MSKIQKFLSSKAATGLLFVVAAALLLFSGIGGARSALTYFSEVYSSEIQLYDIGVTLLENGEDISWRNYDSSRADGTWNTATGTLLSKMLPDGQKLKLGVAYPEVIAAKNSGTIDEYVRISMTTYWTDESGQKIRNLSPSLIEFNYDQSGAWQEDESARTPERRVFYYTNLLPAKTDDNTVEDTITAPLTSTVQVSDSIASKVTQTVTDNEDGTKTIKTVYDYDGIQFNVEAEVDAVQDHNAADAAFSAWGMGSDRIAFSDNTLRITN